MDGMVRGGEAAEKKRSSHLLIRMPVWRRKPRWLWQAQTERKQQAQPRRIGVSHGGESDTILGDWGCQQVTKLAPLSSHLTRVRPVTPRPHQAYMRCYVMLAARLLLDSSSPSSLHPSAAAWPLTSLRLVSLQFPSLGSE